MRAARGHYLDDLFGSRDPFANIALEPGREPLVQVGPARLGEPAISGIADRQESRNGGRDRQRTTPRRSYRDLTGDDRIQGDRKSRPRRRVRPSPRPHSKRTPARSPMPVERHAFVSRQLLEPGGQESRRSSRKVAISMWARSFVNGGLVICALERPILDQHRDQLLEEEGIASRPARRCCGRRAEDASGRSARACPMSAKHSSAVVRRVAPASRASSDAPRAHRAQCAERQEEFDIGHLLHHLLHEIEQDGSGPLQVRSRARLGEMPAAIHDPGRRGVPRRPPQIKRHPARARRPLQRGSRSAPHPDPPTPDLVELLRSDVPGIDALDPGRSQEGLGEGPERDRVHRIDDIDLEGPFLARRVLLRGSAQIRRLLPTPASPITVTI